MDVTSTQAAMSYDRKVPAQKDWGASLSQGERQQIHKSAKSFESMYMSEMMNYMFTDTDMSDNKFGGGVGESTYKSLLVNEYANKFSGSGQAMVAPTLEREMLKIQALQKNPHLDDLPDTTPSSVTSEASHD